MANKSVPFEGALSELGIAEFDAAKYFQTPEAQDYLLADAGATGEANYIKAALDVVARARGMTKVEAATGLRRQAIYRALSEDGNPTLDTLVKVAGALGYRFRIERNESAEPTTPKPRRRQPVVG